MQFKTTTKKTNGHHLRESYSDPSMKFLEWVNSFGIERTWIGKFLTGLEYRFHIRKFGLLFIYSILLAYTLNFDVRSERAYELGDIAKNDVIAPMSFDMVDEVTTEELRSKAEQAIPYIFDYDPTVFERVSGAVYKSFRDMRAEVKNVKWPKSAVASEEKVKEFFSHKSEFERGLGVTVPDYLFEWLTQRQFGARIENIVIRNLDQWYRRKIAENAEKAIPAAESSILARTLQKNSAGKEFELNRKDIFDANNLDLFELVDTKGLEKSQGREREYVLALTRMLIYPNLTMNKQEIANRKRSSRESVLPVTISVKKNQVIIPEGTEIVPAKMALLKEIEILKSDRRKDITTISMGFLFFALILVFVQYLRRFSFQKVKIENRDLWVMGLVTWSLILFVKLFWFTAESTLVSKFGSIFPAGMFLFAAPVATGPMLIGLVIPSGEVVWLFTAFLSIAMGLMTELNLPFMIVTFAGGIAAARGVYSCKKRSDIYRAGVRAGIVNALIIGLLVTISRIDQVGFTQELLSSIAAGFVGGILSSLFTMMVIPLIESAFNYTTDVKLLELSNLNHPLLKEMIVKAPGTYHHSMMVGSMVEAAAEDIGANPLLGKVMCYYHDIGKMEHSNYFIENQKPGQNPHDHISPFMSKTLLIAHVKDGVELGTKHKLGKPIMDGVLQHHGTTLISFFYNKALDAKATDDPEISEEEFRYPGPKPQFREAALCMLADSIEAAARSLDEPTPVRLQNIVRNIVQRKFMDGQLDECSITLKDLSKVENAFTRILLGIYHQRIDYPRSAGGGAGDTQTARS